MNSLGHFRDDGSPNTTVDLQILEAGACSHPEWMVLRGGRFKSIRFPSTVGVLRHPTEGVILFDTGYTDRFYHETKRMPARLYAMVTPTTISPSKTAMMQLLRMGIRPSEVRHIVISHFHADHIAGLKDFPKARFIYHQSAFDAVKNLSGFQAVRNAFLPGLLPKDFLKRSHPLPSTAIMGAESPKEDWAGLDLFGDGSLFLHDLPGHTVGQIGLMAHTRHRPVFFVADACWLEKTYLDEVMPHPITNLLTADPKQYRQTVSKLHRLHQLRPDIAILPCHCESAHNRFEESRHVPSSLHHESHRGD